MNAACAVCVPARDERDALPGLLDALAAQRLPGGGRLRVVLVANNCADGTAALARALAAARPTLALRVIEATLPPGRATVGTARGMAMAAGDAWLRDDGFDDGALISTDADAAPPPGWVAGNLAALAAGADMVGGEIRVAEDPARPAPDWLRRARDAVAAYWAAVRALAHALDPVPHDPPPRHGSHTGASLAIRAALLREAGGVPPLPTGEDNALVAAAERLGGRLRHAPDVWVSVSAREDGRAPGGMAEELRRWRRLAEGGAPHLLPPAAEWCEQFRRRRALRDAFRDGGDALDAAARALGAPAAALRDAARGSRNDVAFVARAWPALPPPAARPWQEIGAATDAIACAVATEECRDR